jgi:hypothetical protein
MKVWYIQNRSGKSGKFYFSEIAYLRATHKNDTRKVFVLEMCDGGISSGQFSESILLKRERDEQISSILGEADDFTMNFSKLKNLFEKICPDIKVRYITKSDILKEFKIISTKKAFSNYATSWNIKNILLFHVSDTVEWYEALLRCHKFQTLPKDGKLPISEARMNNFLEAKKLLKRS